MIDLLILILNTLALSIFMVTLVKRHKGKDVSLDYYEIAFVFCCFNECLAIGNFLK